MTQSERQKLLDAIADKEADLRRASVGSDSYGVGDLDVVGQASAQMRKERLAALQAEREALTAEDPLPTVGVRAVVQMERASGTVGQHLGGLVEVFNDSGSEVTVTAIDPSSKPSALCGRIDIPLAGRKIAAHSWRSFAFGLLAHHPRAGQPLHYVVGATIHLSDDSQLEAESANLTLHSPFDR